MDNHTGKTIPDPELKELLTGYFDAREHALDRGACPGEEALADYLGNRLAPAAQQALEEHLCHCDTCLEAVLAGAALPETEEEESITAIPTSSAHRVLSRIGADERRILPALWNRFSTACASLARSLKEIIFFKEPEALYVRGSRHIISRNLVVIEKTFNEIRLEMEVEKIAEQAANIKVKIRSPETGGRVDGVRVNIMSTSREVASFITAGGEALFENIAFGEYSISIHQNGKKLGHLLLDLKE